MSGQIDYKITMKPQCIPWISAPLPPVYTEKRKRLGSKFAIGYHVEKIEKQRSERKVT